jgi:hypothetical protein
VLDPPLGFLADPAANGQASGSLTATATLIAAVFAGVIALIGTRATFSTAKSQRANDLREKDIAFRRQQLNELYGPVYMLRLSTESSYKALRDHLGVGQAAAPRWALVDHIAELKRDDSAVVFLMTNIVDHNKQIEDILRSKFGLLISHRPPPSFSKFMEHSQQLRDAWNQGVTLPEDIRVKFPRPEFDQDIGDALDKLKEEIDELALN